MFIFFGRWEKCFHGTKYHVVLDIFLYEFLLGSFVNSTICACDEKDYLLVGLLRIDAKSIFIKNI